MDFIEVGNIPDYDVVPGTVYILQGEHQAGSSKRDIILVPTPSTDTKDPLRWHAWRKEYHLFLLVAYSTVLGAITNWESVIYTNLSIYYGVSFSVLNIGSATLLLMLGVANVFFIPISNKFGRRAVYNWTILIVLASQIWMACSKNIGDYQGAHVLLGIGAAPFEALVAISISDIYFAHERGSKLGGYVFGLAFGSFVGPICAGYMAVNQGWRWIYWWGVILSGILFVLFFFTFEESQFTRSVDLHEGAQLQALHHSNKQHEPSEDTSSKKSVGGKQGPREELTNLEPAVSNNVGQVFETSRFEIQYNLWKSTSMPWNEVINEFWRPLKVSMFPAVFWCGINYGTCVSWLSVMGTTISEVFVVPPYLFNNDQVGLIWIAPMIGALIGAYVSGPLNDRLTLYLSNRNRGFREAEYRLWAFIPSAVIMPGGLMIYGICAGRGIHWIAPVIGTGMVGFGLSVGGAATMSYILDCYKELDTQVVTTIILIRNLVGFGITFGIQPWINGMGMQNTFIFVGLLSFVITGFAVFFIVYGKELRRKTTERYGRYAKQNML